MKMKSLIAATLLVCAAGPIVIRAADDIPKQALFARYEAMTNRSPFAVATAAVPPPTTPNFAKDLYIANAARLADEGVVTLTSSTDKNMKEYLSTKEPNPHGYSISNIEWSDHVGQTKVTISKDGQFATLSFNQALATQPMAGMQPQPQQPPPAQPQTVPPAPAVGTVAAPGVSNQIRPAPIPTLPTPPPRVRGVIQRNPIAPAAAVPATGATTKEQMLKEQQAKEAAQDVTDQ
jgi:hypothetical protein